MSRRSAPSVVVAVVVGSAAAGLAGCELQLNSGLPFDAGTIVISPHDAAMADAGAEGGAVDATIDGNPAPVYQGNPLCNASRAIGGCYPDDPITPINAAACDPDGGASDSGSTLSCHVQVAADGTNHAVCLPAGAGTGGASCAGPSDCAPGFECVGKGTCRAYCCSGETRCDTSDGGNAGEFCDIQSATSAASTQVPVCMPIRSCTLWDQVNNATGQNSCDPHETCAVVRDDGTTSCVGIGTAMAGDDCDTNHCAAGLVCLGTPGQRRCYELCDVHADASATCSCKGGLPLFQDPNVGICQ
jgi:hypothetical protein